LLILEEDGVLLSISLLAAAIVLTVTTMAVWQMLVGANGSSISGIDVASAVIDGG
jgi:hypothetical protein